MNAPDFQKAYDEQNRRDFDTNATIATAIQIPLNLFCTIMDYHMYHDKWVIFFQIRVVSVLLVILAWAWHKTPSRGAPHGMGVTWIMSPLLMILWLIYNTGEPGSPYYAGLNIILLGMGLLTPWAKMQNILVTVFVLVAYVLISKNIKTREELKIIVNNMTFLFLTCVIVVSGSIAGARLRYREFKSQWDLKAAETQLVGKNVE